MNLQQYARQLETVNSRIKDSSEDNSYKLEAALRDKSAAEHALAVSKASRVQASSAWDIRKAHYIRCNVRVFTSAPWRHVCTEPRQHAAGALH